MGELPQGKQVLIFVFNLLTKVKTLEQAIEETKPLMQLVFYCMDKVKRYKLSREEKKKRELKERIREIEDPEKQRKMEERENRREKKKAQPKMKQLKVN